MSQAQNPPSGGGGTGTNPPGTLLQLANTITPSIGGGVGGLTGNGPGNRPLTPEVGGGDNVVGGQLGGTIIIVIPRP